MTDINLSNRQKKVRVDMPWLKRFSKIALEESLKHPRRRNTPLDSLDAVDVILVSDRVIADVHVQFMDVEGPTDVITFDHGEILISTETAAENAGKYHKPFIHEIALYIIHGLLHLHGYEDKTRDAAREMHRLQDRILKTCLAKVC